MDGFYTGKPLFPNGMIWGYKTVPTYFWRSIQDFSFMARLLGNAACLGLLSVVVADTSLETRFLEIYSTRLDECRSWWCFGDQLGELPKIVTKAMGEKGSLFQNISMTIAAVFFSTFFKKVHPGTLGKIKWSNLTHIFVLGGWFNHQLATDFVDGIVGPVLWVWSLQITPRKTNMAAENWSLQKEIPNLEFPSILESSQ